MNKFSVDEISKVEVAREFLKTHLDSAPSLGVITGSGIGGLADIINDQQKIRFEDIPGFPKTSVEGHQGYLIKGQIEGWPVCLLQGRVHYYEGFSLPEVVFPVRTLAAWGIENCLVTNSAGAVNPLLRPGELMLISDHINLMGDNPLCGPNQEQWGKRFPDMSSVYDFHLNSILAERAAKTGITLHRGVYAAVKGPSFETPAEIRMLSKLGVDAVGMSTVPEVIALRHMGKSVAGVSCIANLAAGLGNDILNHENGLRLVAESSLFLSRLVSGLCSTLSERSSAGESNARP